MRVYFFSVLANREVPMTFAAVRKELQSFGYTIRKRDDEYRVNRAGGAEATAYDLPDALATARESFRRENANGESLRVTLAVERLPNLARLTSAEHAGERDDATKPKLTTRRVSRELQRREIRGELRQGNGYLYFVGEDFDRMYSSSVAVCWLNDLSLDGWLAEARYLLENDRNVGCRVANA